MSQKYRESKLANHIGFVISEILTSIGSVFFFYALIKLEIAKNSSEWYYTPDSTLLDMKEYGLAILIAGIVALIICFSNIKNIHNQENDSSSSENKEKRKPEANTRLGEEIEDMDIDEIESVIEQHTRKKP